MNYNDKFKKDLNGGQIGEKIIAKYLKDNFKYEIIDFGNDNQYDIKTKKNEKEILFEIKTDRWEYFKNKTTNNIFIELSCSGKLSGIHTTKSNCFVYFFPDQEEAFFIKTKELKELIKTPGLKITEQSGDDGRVKGILLNKIEFRNNFNVVTIQKSKIWDKLDEENKQ
ncbi:MAG: hypothetical protein ACOVK2_02875 [Candidatus Fonsibacter sp.]